MKKQLDALRAEFIKNKYANILWVTFIAFGLAPVMGGIFMLIIRDPEALARAGGLSMKIKMMNVSADWNSYFMVLKQAIGVGGVFVFGFVASWIFGREYSEGTAKDLLALPTTRTKILNAKFTVYVIWCLALVISNLTIGTLIGTLLQLEGMTTNELFGNLVDYTITTILTVSLGSLIAFFAIWGKGYLAPLGFVALTLVFAQVIAAAGYGTYFPWSIPGLYSSASGELEADFDYVSYIILAFTSVLGYFATIFYWKYSDQSI